MHPVASYAINATLGFTFSRAREPVLVNSFGRSGSTVMHDAIAQAATRRAAPTVAHNAIRNWAWPPQPKLAKGCVYKSHSYPRPEFDKAKTIYVFGDPLSAAASAFRMSQIGADTGWWQQHCTHLELEPPFPDPHQVLLEDCLQTAKHLAAWLNTKNTLFIRYESLWSHGHELSEFLGFTIRFPERRARSQDSQAVDSSGYRTAIDLVNSLPTCFVSS